MQGSTVDNKAGHKPDSYWQDPPAESSMGVQVGELYIRLACQHDPRAVLPFLQSSDAFRVQAMLPLCHQHGVHDAEAYLLERLGDVQAALELLCSEVEACTQQLVASVLQGGIMPDASPLTPLHRASTLVRLLLVTLCQSAGLHLHWQVSETGSCSQTYVCHVSQSVLLDPMSCLRQCWRHPEQ